MSLHSPADFAEIVENYIDGWRKNGWIPEVGAFPPVECEEA